jgi:hypothetical protein
MHFLHYLQFFKDFNNFISSTGRQAVGTPLRPLTQSFPRKKLLFLKFRENCRNNADCFHILSACLKGFITIIHFLMVELHHNQQ